MALPGWLLDRGYRGLVRPVLFHAADGDAEAIHEATVTALGWAGERRWARGMIRLLAGSRGDPVTVGGVRFANRVGLAAGMDKNACAVHAWPAMGFGHVELGTVTALAQPGNPRPRMFRLPASGGLINRMGFNNDGAAVVAERLARLSDVGVPLGISIGKSKVTPIADAVADYVASYDQLASCADYVAINVSSPNTEGLRELQESHHLADLLDALTSRTPRRPILVKMAPDLTDAQLDALIEVCTVQGASGFIATNTSITRPPLAAPDQVRGAETGGLSGRPLTALALGQLRTVCARTNLPVIASGGIMTADDASRALDAGAQLVQILTGLVYRGPALVREINEVTR